MTVSLLSDGSLDDLVKPNSGVVLIDVWAEWCTPCRALAPIFERLSVTYEGRVRCFKCDADANPDTVSRFAVRALPSVLVLKDGELVDRVVGVQLMAQYIAAIERQLNPLVAEIASAPAPVRGVAAGPTQEAKELLTRGEATLVFKHSNSCPVSFRAKRHFDAFVAAHPDVAIRLVVVQQERELSNALETVSGVLHESPQALVMRDGRVLFHASHGDITEARLAAALTEHAGSSTLR